MKETEYEKKAGQHASCRLKDEEEAKEEKGRRREKEEEVGGEKKTRRTEYGNIQLLRSHQFTGTFRSQVLEKALAAVPQSLSRSFPPLLCPLLSVSPPSFFSILSYDPGGVTIGEVLPAVSFPSVCECSLSQHPGSIQRLIAA